MLDMTAAVRAEVYAQLAETGRAPTVVELAASFGRSSGAVRAALRSLHVSHDLVLGAEGEVRMALPFSAVATPFVVSAGGIDRWANCAWDALAVPLVIRRDSTIHAVWAEDSEPFELAVRHGRLDAPRGLVHFAIAARHWWDDIVET